MITINGLQIDDNVSFITEEVTYKSSPTRTIYSQDLSRRPGSKLTGVEWGSKEIEIKGRVFGTTVSGLIGNVDTLQQNASVQSLALSIDPGRTYTATLESLDIPTQFYNQTMASFDAMFLAIDPFAYGNQVTVSGTVISGTVTYSGVITISGNVWAGPVLSITPLGGSVGNSGITSFKVTHVPTGETMTVSGTMSYQSPVSIDYNNFFVTNSGILSDYQGIFSRWVPGNVNFTIAVISGTKQQYQYSFAYSPRYFQ
jgi:cytoskeletal protein CcmA (bactofilin family)